VQAGDFAWCAFPERENPARPGPEHIGYVLAVTTTQPATVLIAYTTSRPWPYQAIPPGIVTFDLQAAQTMGQTRPFVMDLRRLAAIPLTPAWFPRLGQPSGGIVGTMPKPLQRRYSQAVEALFTRHPENIERLGPLWPPP
jgi:hypothetical protein